MKKYFLIVLFFCTTAFVYSKEIKQTLKSEVNEVTVFLSGAQVGRSANASLNSGVTTLVFEDLSPQINASSVQAKGIGNFTILSVIYQINYLKYSAKTKEMTMIEDSLEYLNDQLSYQTAMKNVYLEEEKMLLANKVIGGQDAGVKVLDLKDATEYFRTRLTDIYTKQLAITTKIKKINEQITKLSAQLSTLNTGLNKPTGEILVTVSANEPSNAKLSISYIVSNAGWTPVYDLRSSDINSPIKLNYKANVFQSSGENWNDVKLTLSTGNPFLSGTRPTLLPWFLRFQNIYDYTGGAGYYNMMPAQSRAESAKLSKEMEDIKPTAPATTIADFTTVSESQTSIEFEISLPYSIATDGKNNLVEIQNYTLPAKYEYYCAPKLDKDAFLMAKVSGWESYNLLSGEMNLFFEGTYVGKSYIDVRTTKDTLDISLGRDKNIVVTRIKLNDFSSKQFIGTNQKETFAWEINVRNKKKQAIDITIDDQVPISTDKEIEVETTEYTGASYNKESGKLSWKFKLEPSESKKKLKIVYSVKYPKDKTLNIQ